MLLCFVILVAHGAHFWSVLNGTKLYLRLLSYCYWGHQQVILEWRIRFFLFIFQKLYPVRYRRYQCFGSIFIESGSGSGSGSETLVGTVIFFI